MGRFKVSNMTMTALGLNVEFEIMRWSISQQAKLKWINNFWGIYLDGYLHLSIHIDFRNAHTNKLTDIYSNESFSLFQIFLFFVFLETDNCEPQVASQCVEQIGLILTPMTEEILANRWHIIIVRRSLFRKDGEGRGGSSLALFAARMLGVRMRDVIAAHI